MGGGTANVPPNDCQANLGREEKISGERNTAAIQALASVCLDRADLVIDGMTEQCFARVWATASFRDGARRKASSVYFLHCATRYAQGACRKKPGRSGFAYCGRCVSHRPGARAAAPWRRCSRGQSAWLPADPLRCGRNSWFAFVESGGAGGHHSDAHRRRRESQRHRQAWRLASAPGRAHPLCRGGSDIARVRRRS